MLQRKYLINYELELPTNNFLRHSPSCIVGLLQIVFPMLVAVLPFRFFRKTRQFIVGVVFNLICVVGNQFFWFAKGLGNAVFHCAVAIAVVTFFGTVLRFNQQHGHTFGCCIAVVVVREPRESQSFKERTHLTADFTEIIWRTKYKHISFCYLFQNWRKCILKLARLHPSYHLRE